MRQRPVVVQRPLPTVQTLQKTIEISLVLCKDKFVDVPGVVQVARGEGSGKTVEIQQFQNAKVSVVEKPFAAPQNMTEEVMANRSDETEDATFLMQSMVTRLGKKLVDMCKNGDLGRFQPDSKTQVKIEHVQSADRYVEVGKITLLSFPPSTLS